MAEQYTYAVARIHAIESSLLTAQDLEQLISCRSMTEALNVLSDKGMDTNGAKGADEVVHRERAAMWKLISELVSDMSVFDVFLYGNDFHNLKAAVKLTVCSDVPEHVFINEGTVPAAEIADAVKKREFERLPHFMRKAAEDAVQQLLETGDGGLCDVMLDRVYLEALTEAGKRSGCDMIERYAEQTAALADIRIAVRGAALGKTAAFFARSIAECETLDAAKLGTAAAKGMEDVLEYIRLTPYSGAADAIGESYTAFEKWCDDRIMEDVRREKYNQFTIAPIAAYILAKETELKAVGLILTGKQNMLDVQLIRERLRELYV